jgi:hypothetical protein
MSRELDEDINMDITDEELREIFNKTPDKIDGVIEEKNRLGLKLHFFCSKDLKKVEVTLLDADNNQAGYVTFECSEGRICSCEPIFLSTEIDDEELRGKNFSWLMLGTLISKLKENIKIFEIEPSIGLGPTTILGIDADASGGYWKHIGLHPTKYTWDTDKPRRIDTSEAPFELTTTLTELSLKILGEPFSSSGGRKKKRQKKSHRKHKKSHKKTKKNKTNKKRRRHSLYQRTN